MTKPTVNGSASICTWDLQFYFLDKSQVNKFIDKLIQDSCNFKFEYELNRIDDEERHYVTVSGSWATNLLRLAKILKKVDYCIDD